jgi:hypothetical protein
MRICTLGLAALLNIGVASTSFAADEVAVVDEKEGIAIVADKDGNVAIADILEVA